MRLAWLSSARWCDWRKRCNRIERQRLLQRLTESFVDRTAIDWSSLLTRGAPGADRAVVENLRLLDGLRSSFRSGEAPDSREPPAVVWLVAFLAIVHTVVSLVIVFLMHGQASAPPLHFVRVTLAVAFIAACGLLAATAARDPRRAFLLATFACGASAFARGAVAGVPPTPMSPALRSLWLDVFAPACLWQFAVDFPRVTRFTKFDRFARRAATAAWMFGTIVFCLNAAVAAELLHEGPFAAMLPNRRSNVFWQLFTAAVLLAVGAILIRSRRAPLAERGRVRRLSYAIALGTAPFLITGALRSILPSFDLWLITASAAGRMWPDLIVVGPLAAMPVLSAIAVIADRPFERQMPIERFLKRRLALPAPGFSSQVAALAEALARISCARTRREICGVVVDFVRSRLSVTDVRILVPNADGLYQDAFHETSLSSDTALARIIRGAAAPLSFYRDHASIQLLPHADRAWLESTGIELLVPIRRRDDSVAALVACGSKRGRSRFSRRDLSLLNAVASAVSAVWDSTESAADPAFECPQCGVVADELPLGCGCGYAPVLASLPLLCAGEFIVQRRIGRGGMAVVYLARDIVRERDVALKTVPRLEPGVAVRLRDEARAMAALRHEALATIQTFLTWHDTPILVLEYFPQGTLARRLRSGPLALTDTLWLVRRLADALVYLHKQNLIHGDLKPANIALDSQNGPRLLDFGLTALIDRGLSGRVQGTIPYLPPEAFRGATPGPTFDLWALAVVTVEALTGTHPFAAGSRRAIVRRIVRVHPAEIASRIAGIGPWWSAVLERALDPEPSRRFQTAEEFRNALNAPGEDRQPG